MKTNYMKKGPGRATNAYTAENKQKLVPVTPERLQWNVSEDGLPNALRSLGFGTSKQDLETVGELLMEERSNMITRTWEEAWAACARSQMLRPKVVEIRRGRPMPQMAMEAAA